MRVGSETLKFGFKQQVDKGQYGVYANTTSTAARTSSENVTSRFCNHFSIIQGHHGCKMCSNFPGIKLEPALQR